MDTFLQQIVNGLTLGCVYAVVALGYTMVYGIIQLINFAHGEVVMIGAMAAYSVIVALVGAHVALPPLAIVLIGLFVAIPAVWAYNYFQNRVDRFTVEMSNSGSEMSIYLLKEAGTHGNSPVA